MPEPQLKLWRGTWRYNNPRRYELDGKTGTETVLAKDAKDAQSKIARAGSKSLLGTDSMYNYMRVSDVQRVP